MALRHLPRLLKTTSALFASLLVITCADNTAPDDRGTASVNVRPVFNAFAQFAPLTLNRVQVVVERITFDSLTEGRLADTLSNVTRNFSVTSTELRLNVPVPLRGDSEELDVTLTLLADNTVLFTGTETMTISLGGGSEPVAVDVDYVGPGSNAVGVILEPRDTTVSAGSRTPMRATAINNQGADIGPFYLSWSLVGASSGARVDANGAVTAPGTPDTFWVKGVIPNGQLDSVRMIVTAAPTSMTIFSGDHQSGSPGSGLQLPLQVRVNGSGGAPVPGILVTWAATIGGGAVEPSTSVTGDDGVAQTVVSLGPNPGLHRYTATSTGLGTVTFSANEDQTGTVAMWEGNTNSSWSDSENWAGSRIPGILDSVVIPSAEFYPILDTTPIVSALTLRGNASITLNSHGLVIIRGLSVTGNATVVMADGSDAMTVGGDAVFDGGNSDGTLTAGGISIAGNFTQRATTSGASFLSSGTHLVAFSGSNPTITFATPGVGNNQSHFNDVGWIGSGTMTLGSNVVGTGAMTAGFQGGATSIASSAGRELRAATLVTSGQVPLIFNNVTLSLVDTTDASIFLSNIVFQNMATNRVQLSLSYPGGSATLNNFTFSTVPVAPNGFYLSAEDTIDDNDSSLLVSMRDPNPIQPGVFFREIGESEIVWPLPPQQ